MLAIKILFTICFKNVFIQNSIYNSFSIIVLENFPAYDWM